METTIIIITTTTITDKQQQFGSSGELQTIMVLKQAICNRATQEHSHKTFQI